MPPEEGNGAAVLCDTNGSLDYPSKTSPGTPPPEQASAVTPLPEQASAETPPPEGWDEEYDNSFEQPPFSSVMSTYMGLGVFVVFGHFRELLRRLGLDKTMSTSEYGNEGFVPLYRDFESFYTRNIYQRVCPFWSHPLAGVPGAEIEIWDRKFGDFNENMQLQNTKRKYINIGSYNYLGFAENAGRCSEETIQEIRCGAGTSTASPRAEYGTLAIHLELEKLIARFVGKEDCLVFGMGFATNSMNMASLVSEGGLLISDELNHTSLVLGARLSGAKIKVFKHNDMKHLEQILRRSIVEGQPRTRRPWKKILIVVEGIYSMEGTSCDLPKIVALKKKYKAYLYVDEAHSIGAVGGTGRGVCEHFGVNPADVDILMGTFSKSFGAAGGYIAADRDIIAHLRKESHAQSYSSSISPPVCRQTIAATKAIMGIDGSNDGKIRIDQLSKNSRYFRRQLKERGYIVFGELHSPVVPVLMTSIAQLVAFAKMSLTLGLAPVVVGFPATPMLGSRARFCMSSSHTREQLDWILDVLEKMEPELGLKMSPKHRNKLYAIKS